MEVLLAHGADVKTPDKVLAFCALLVHQSSITPAGCRFKDAQQFCGDIVPRR